MKKGSTVLSALVFLLALCANGKTHSNSTTLAPAGNIADGIYMIVGFDSHRCLDIPNGSCRDGARLQIFDCDPTDATNSQKFIVASDGAGNYTISPAHSDLCLEVVSDPASGQNPIQQSVCTPGKISQKWAMSQYGSNLEIRTAGTNKCMDVSRAAKANFGEVQEHNCKDSTNQRWNLHPKTLNANGVICRASPSHPEYDCFGLNEKQTRTYLGKTVTRTRCEEACNATKMLSLQRDVPR
jgi:hypothetical protein